MVIVPAQEALRRLRDGNARFVANNLDSTRLADPALRSQLAAGQDPFAIILGCSDSRAPVELVFDQGLGDLFVIRIAGNIVAPSGIGSVEFAAEAFGVQLVVVLGHSSCGAVEATVDALGEPDSEHSRNLAAIVDRVAPAVRPLLEDANTDREELIKAAVEANVRHSVDQLKSGSAILEKLIDAGRLTVVGAQYSLDTGEVSFIEASG